MSAAVAINAGPRRGWKSASTWIGAFIVGVRRHLRDLRAAARAARSVRAGPQPRACSCRSGWRAQSGIHPRHRPARPRLSFPPDLGLPHLDADRRHRHDRVGPDRHHHRRAGRLLRRTHRRRRAVRHHHAPLHPRRPRGAGRRRPARHLDDPAGADPRPAAVGSLRRGGALDLHAGAQPRLRRRRPGAPAARASACCRARCCPTSPAISSWWRRSRSRSPSCSRRRCRSWASACRRRCRRGA